MSSKPMDRRTFMGSIAVTAGGGVAASLLPVSLLQAGEITPGVATPRYPDPCGDWTLDDMCSAYPGYSFDFRGPEARQVAEIRGFAAIDRMWVP
jgi:hypothetical protein